MQADDKPTWEPPPRLPEFTIRTLRHEVGDLLQTVYASVAILNQRLPENWELERRILGDMRHRGEACKEMLDQVHDLIGTVTLNPERVDLAELVRGLTGGALSRYPLLRLHEELAPGQWVEADAKRLAGVSRFLLRHAGAAARKHLSVRVEPASEPATVAWTIEHDGSEVSVEQADALFDPANPTPRSLPHPGLLLLRKVIEMHGGSVRVQPREGGGLCYRLTLPAAGPTES
jgi:signal transduction histidine kinase